jgi:hypothetical protein
MSAARKFVEIDAALRKVGAESGVVHRRAEPDGMPAFQDREFVVNNRLRHGADGVLDVR